MKMKQIERYVIFVVVYTSMCIYLTAYIFEMSWRGVSDSIINTSNISLVNYSVWFETRNKFILLVFIFRIGLNDLFLKTNAIKFNIVNLL